MEITLEAIISFIGLFVGGGAGAFFTWKWQKKKAKAEAENAEIDAAKELQGMYQTMLQDANTWLKDAHDKVDGLRQERDHYKKDRDELRENMEKLRRSVIDWKQVSEDERSEMKMQIARLGRKVEMMAPFMCGDLSCKLRQRVTISEDGVVKKAIVKKEQIQIETNNEEL